MKRVVSVSLGSSERDHRVVSNFYGELFEIERIGTNASMEKAIELIKKLDGEVDAFGMGGIDLYIWAGNKQYTIREAKKLKAAAVNTPILDGSGLKNTLERRVINYLSNNNIVDFSDRKVLLTSAMDRFGMADALYSCGAKLVIGDLIFALGIGIPLNSLKTLNRVASLIAPIACRLPFNMLYPTGEKQRYNNATKFSWFYNEADVIAGDYHYIKKYMPQNMSGKIIITNTVTQKDVENLRSRGVKLLVTTTPELEGRSFGTNVMEAMVVAVLRGKGLPESKENYFKVLQELDFKPRIEYLNWSLKQGETSVEI